MKYVLTQQVKDFIKSMCPNEKRANEIIEFASNVFNSEQSSCHFIIGRMSEETQYSNYAHLFLSRKESCEEVAEDWELTDEEIDSIGTEEKIAA